MGISQTHGDIIAHLFHLSGLGTNLPLTDDARALALRSMQFFERTVFAHHQAEEQRLFPLVLAQSADGAEREYLDTMIAKLTGEHRRIEALWTRLENLLKELLEGRGNAAIDGLIQELALDYGDHATDEEARFLPLCQEVLGRGGATPTAAELLHQPAA
ncbi:hemerythrin domain-containing protein [Curvibacter sp. APW13]|uniref:hemerythrin domain-containing protein n=1 Tax=Curvibacter sp. APW13 TaxID=3077236 RepID=UPI0028E07B93|nr:hemerythrin domain-containing protein [Curvibacter sp. APW13]MDT8990264.1 hemerythrin domain-containing protein [Curvibacter sp. APW13]